MKVHQESFTLRTSGKGTYEITHFVRNALRASRLQTGQITAFCRHTSCSLVLMENADPSARRDLENFLDRLVPDDDPQFTHTYEGPDDMPSHIKMALTRSSESIPVLQGRLLLGTWLGLYLWEHRVAPHHRHITVTCLGECAQGRGKRRERE
ncbi:MAG: YjbQ family protein [Opitutae bacterium]|nr:YjbQ family protein [Opitutae bacterium]